MPNDPILHLLGLAKKAGKLELGEEPVGALCRARHARLVLLAGNAAPNTYRRAAHFGESGNVLWLALPHSKEELGFLFGRGSVAMMALSDAGLAASLVDKLAATDPERYGPAAAQLRIKADKMLQRQREKRQHEKNLRTGKVRQAPLRPSLNTTPNPRSRNSNPIPILPTRRSRPDRAPRHPTPERRVSAAASAAPPPPSSPAPEVGSYPVNSVNLKKRGGFPI